ncbi:MAG: hypothetical protein FJW88_05260 [Actinobacteria bacterium]|nr:hypothetical protein [Actinomycetota bacterium]
MNPFQIVMRTVGARRGSRAYLYLVIASFGFRAVRRVMSTKQRTLLRFEVRPGERYEIRGLRRGQ